MIVVLELLNVIDEPDKGHIPPILNRKFLLKRKSFQLKFTDRLFYSAMPILRHIQVTIRVLRVVHIKQIIAIGVWVLLIEWMMVFHHVLVG